ncbi:hypothetical protein I6A60_00515 [Frankia sp. AgB1.9]|uniref:hypothetical protein n=1 Tax=unclassified Frankia TaxID=2632575 RepID=UPI001933823A|nr:MULTISPECIES: hypothetical protein [unclassified Frankia]MBL7487363.1 hypothetical protein [Frankia sp. AgW1.1]MBL7546371.1 hypothetical protein [Frankia sp. AgB1.9]MBL7618584.1 hypothetical protein [Frankia sp. AgB1.8]
MSQSSGMPDGNMFRAASLCLIVAGWRRDTTATEAVIAEILSTPRPAKNVVVRQLRALQAQRLLITALVTSIGELLRSEDPTAALAEALEITAREGAGRE